MAAQIAGHTRGSVQAERVVLLAEGAGFGGSLSTRAEKKGCFCSWTAACSKKEKESGEGGRALQSALTGSRLLGSWNTSFSSGFVVNIKGELIR